MTSLGTARETIYETFAAAWGTTTPIAFDNEAFNPPTDGSSWVRVVVRHDSSNLEAIGGRGFGGMNLYQRTGRLVIQVFVREDKGTEEADSLAQAARAIFEGTTLSSNAIRFNNGIVREVGQDSPWFQVNLEVAFQYDERK